MADELTPTQDTNTPVPPPPQLEAPGQLVNVRALSGKYKGQVVKIPVERYTHFSQSGDVDLVIPTVDAQGSPHWTNARDWGKELQKGFLVDFNDRDQIPLVYQLSQQLEARDPDALQRFLTPFWNALVGSVPEELRNPDKKHPNISRAEGVIQLLNPTIGAQAATIKQILNIPKAWVAAAKAPTSSETTEQAVASLPVPFAPEIAVGTQEATTGNIAGAMGNAALAGGGILLQELGPKISEYIMRPAGEATPDLLTSTRAMRNTGAQREIVAKIHEISPRLLASDIDTIRNWAGAELRTADELNEQAKLFEQRGKEQAKIDEQVLKDVAQRGQRAAEQTQRVLDLNEINRLATEVGGTPRPPIQQAELVMDVARQAQGITDEIERAIYPQIYRQAAAADIQTDIAPVGRLIARETRASVPAQMQLGVSGVSGRALEGASKLQAGASGTPAQIRQALELGDVGQLTPNQLDAMNTLMQAMENQQNHIPFAVADEAQRGLGTSIRYLQKAKAGNPNVAPDLRLLQTIQAQLKTQIAESLAPYDDIHELYDRAREVTREQHDVIDQNVVKKMFTDPRNQLAGETLVGALLKTGTEKLQGAILQSLDIGPAAQRALTGLRDVNPQEATRITQRLADLAGHSAEAKAGLRDIVVRAAIRKGTALSTTEGATSPKLNYNAMIQFLEDRPGARTLLGDRYDPLLRNLRAKADAALRQTDPDYESFIQKQTARYEIQRTPVKPTTGAAEAHQELSEAEFVKKLTNDAIFRRGAVRNATPAIRQRMVRSLIEDGTQDAMVRGVPGTPDAVIDFGKWGKNLADRATAIAEIGGVPTAARELQGLGRAAERADMRASTGLVARMYGFLTGVGTKMLRMSVNERPGVFAVGPKQIRGQIGVPEPPVELPSVSRNLDQDLFRASQDPELARMMKRALKLKPWEPGSGTFALKYYLAFAGGKPDQGKALDDRTAAQILAQAGGEIDKAVPIAQAMGYTH